MLHRLSISDLQAICDRYENLQKNLPPMVSMGSEEYRYARATLDRIQKQKEAEGHSTQILQMVHRIDQHLDVVEEKIDGVPIRPPSPETQLASQLEIQKREMEAMKGMMEMMRLDKERLEMEVKRRVEEDAATTLRAKQEVEAAAKLQQEKKELDAIFQQFQNYVVRTPDLRFENPSAYTFGKNEKQLLTMIENSGETILSVGFSNHIVYGNPDAVTISNPSIGSGIYPNVQSRGISLILTNRQLYGVYYNTAKAEYCENVHIKYLIKMNHMMSFQCVSLYQFSEPLNIKYATMLLYILKKPTNQPSLNQPSLNRPSLWSYVTMLEPSDIDGNSSNTILKRFESIIRLIPGAYQNGDWRQLDGFFGMYYNETTMDVSEYPPPL